MTPPRVLITCDSLRRPVRGVGRVCETLLPGLRERCASVVPLDHEPNDYAAELAGRECTVIPAPKGPAKTARWHANLLRRIPALGIDHDVLIGTSGFPFAFGRHPRLVVFVHDLHMLERGFYQSGKRLWFRAFLRRGLERAALRVCVSEHTKRDLERRFPSLDPNHNVVVHNAVAEGLVDSDAGASHDGPFLFVGQFERRKNLMRVLDAYEGARRQGVRTELHLAGRRGPGGDEILARARELGDSVRVHEDASDAELRELYANARAVLLPSLHEGFGLPVVEAMRAGAPVLTSTGTALAEVAGDAAMLVEPTDVGAIERGIARLDGDATLRRELADKGRERAAEFTPEAQASKLLDAIQSLG